MAASADGLWLPDLRNDARVQGPRSPNDEAASTFSKTGKQGSEGNGKFDPESDGQLLHILH
jgi:hypothetical protein